MATDVTNNRQTARNLIFNTIAFVINFVIAFFFTPYLIRVVGKEAYSFFPLINNMIGYTAIITTAVGSMASRFITMRIYKEDYEDANRYLNAMWVANLFLSTLFTLVGVVVVVYIDDILTVPSFLLSDVRWLFGLGLFSIILGLLTGYLSIPAYVKNRVDLSSIITVATLIIRISVIIALFAFFKPSIVYMSLSALVAALVGVGLNYQLKKKLLPELIVAPRRYFNISYVKTLVNSGIWNSFTQLSNTLLTQLDLFITNIFIGAAVTGDFAIAKTAPNLILQLLAMFAGTFAAQFNILYAQGEIEKVVVEVRKSMVIIGVLIGIPIGFLAVFSDSFYNLWVPGQNITMLYWLTVFTVLPMVFGASINPVFNLFATTNKLRVPSIVVLIAGLLQTAVVVLLLKTTELGVWAIVLTSAVQSVLRNSIFTPIYGAYVIGKPWYTFYPTMFRGIFGVITVVLIDFLIKHFFTVDTWFMFFFVGFTVSAISLFVNSYVMLKKSERKRVSDILSKKIPFSMIKRIFNKWTLTVLLILFAIIAIIPYFYFNGKKVHFSFDDVSICMKELTNDSTKYNSIFDHPFLCQLKELHNSTGAKFTLFVYEYDGDYRLCDFPNKFAEEFHQNAGWLKVGYHAMSPSISRDSIDMVSVFIPSFNRVDSILTTKFKRAKSSVIRLHYFHATQEEVNHLRDKGITTLLAADDDRISYSLTETENSELMKKEVLEKNGMTYISTDHRVERDNTLIGLIRNAEDDEFVIFTHEWAYYGSVHCAYNFLVRYLSFYNCKFE